jgi:hypothetical protein
LNLAQAASRIRNGNNAREALLKFVLSKPDEVFRISDFVGALELAHFNYKSICNAARHHVLKGNISSLKRGFYCYYGAHEAIMKLERMLKASEVYPVISRLGDSIAR